MNLRDLANILGLNFWLGVLGSLVAALIGLGVGLLWRPSSTWLLRVRRRFKRLLFPAGAELTENSAFSFDAHAHGVRFSGSNAFVFSCTKRSTPPDLPMAFAEHKIGLSRKFVNQPGYQLVNVGSRRETRDLDPLLELAVAETDYATFQSVNMRLNELDSSGRQFRDRCLPASYGWEEPIPGLGHCLSVNLLLLTSDERLLVARRSASAKGIGMYPGRWMISVGETLNWDVDRFDARGTFLRRCMIRGTDEELGVDIGADLEFIALQVSEEYSQWGLIALARTELNASELKQATKAATTIHRWENGDLTTVSFDPKRAAADLVDIAPQRADWVPGALTAVVLGLTHLHPRQSREIIAGFAKRYQ